MKYILTFLSVVLLSVGSSLPALALESSAVKTPAAQAEAAVHKEAININTADVQELVKLKGVGPKKAEAIIVWRKENGDFKTIDQLLEVKGIGEATLNANRENIRI
jgi:competence protein ComEA